MSKHLKNIFESRELVESSVVSILETTGPDGKNYQTRFYKLDAIIAFEAEMQRSQQLADKAAQQGLLDASMAAKTTSQWRDHL